MFIHFIYRNKKTVHFTISLFLSQNCGFKNSSALCLRPFILLFRPALLLLDYNLFIHY